MNKQEEVLALFFKEPTKHWHFEEVLTQAKISRPQASQWLKKFTQEGLVRRIKPLHKMPHYIADYDKPAYRIKKRIYTMTILYQSGLTTHLMTLPQAKTVIIFGSFSRADWYEESDIDIFIYGSPAGLETKKYESALHREIQVFNAQTIQDFKKMGEGLLLNILKGQVIKGNPNFLAVKLHA